jgi:hypothetical protein
MLVKFKEGTSPSARLTVLTRVNGTVAETILTNAMKHSGDNEGIALVKIPMAALDAIDRLKGSAEIEYVEPNWTRIDALSRLIYQRSLWGCMEMHHL